MWWELSGCKTSDRKSVFHLKGHVNPRGRHKSSSKAVCGEQLRNLLCWRPRSSSGAPTYQWWVPNLGGFPLPTVQNQRFLFKIPSIFSSSVFRAWLLAFLVVVFQSWMRCFGLAQIFQNYPLSKKIGAKNIEKGHVLESPWLRTSPLIQTSGIQEVPNWVPTQPGEWSISL